MAWTRRQLLQAGSLLWLGDRLLAQPLPLLAAPAPRRLALLVGIDRFQAEDIPPLYGAGRDVQQLALLLTERFGFAPNDIVTLTQSQATRRGIEAAILGHLGQAGTDDFVFLHVSSHGRFWQRSSSDRPERGIVVHDSRAATATENNDLSLSTLQFLLQSLGTTRGWVSLDVGFAMPDRGSDRFLMRGVAATTAPERSPEAQLAQEQLRRRTGQRNRTSAAAWPIPVVIANGTGASPELPHRQGPLGLLTAQLLQQAWAWPSPNAQTLRQRLSSAIAIQRDQKLEQLGPSKGTGELAVSQAGLAEVRDRSASNLTATLVGDVTGLPTGDPSGGQLRAPSGALFTITEQRDRRLSLRSPYPEAVLETGDLLQEAVRHLPEMPAIVLGCSPEIERIERVDLASALSTLPHVTTASALESACQGLLLHSDRDGYRLVDAQHRDRLQCQGKTLKELGQALKQQLPLWLARHRLTQLQNDGAESLPLSWVWRSSDRKKRLAQRQTASVPLTDPGPEGAIVPLSSPTQVWNLRNSGDRAAELLLLLEDRQGQWWVWGWQAPEPLESEATEAIEVISSSLPPIELLAGSEQTISLDLSNAKATSGTAWAIASHAPLENCRQAIAAQLSSSASLLQPLENPSLIFEALVADLQATSQAEGTYAAGGGRLLSLSLWATLAIAWQQS